LERGGRKNSFVLFLCPGPGCVLAVGRPPGRAALYRRVVPRRRTSGVLPFENAGVPGAGMRGLKIEEKKISLRGRAPPNLRGRAVVFPRPHVDTRA